MLLSHQQTATETNSRLRQRARQIAHHAIGSQHGTCGVEIRLDSGDPAQYYLSVQTGDETLDYVTIDLLGYYKPRSLFIIFREAFRLLRYGGHLFVHFADENTTATTEFNTLYAPQKVLFELAEAGFRHIDVKQLWKENPLAQCFTVIPGYGEGELVVIHAVKRKQMGRTAIGKR